MIAFLADILGFDGEAMRVAVEEVAPNTYDQLNAILEDAYMSCQELSGKIESLESAVDHSEVVINNLEAEVSANQVKVSRLDAEIKLRNKDLDNTSDYSEYQKIAEEIALNEKELAMKRRNLMEMDSFVESKKQELYNLEIDLERERENLISCTSALSRELDSYGVISRIKELEDGEEISEEEEEKNFPLFSGYSLGENNFQMRVVKEITKRKSKFKFHLYLREAKSGYREEDELKAYLRERMRKAIDKDPTKNLARSLIAAWADYSASGTDMPILKWLADSGCMDESEMAEYIMSDGNRLN